MIYRTWLGIVLLATCLTFGNIQEISFGRDPGRFDVACYIELVPVQEHPAFVKQLEDGHSQKIVTYGTSLTAGGAWVSQLSQTLEREYPGLATVINAGQGAMWSKWGVENLDQRVLTYHPDVVFIEFGINDAYSEYQTTVDQARLNLESMIDRVIQQNANAEIILLIMNPPSGVHLSKRPSILEYEQLYRDVAKERQLRLIDFSIPWRSLLRTMPSAWTAFVPDGIHPELEATSELITPCLMRGLGLSKEPTPLTSPELADGSVAGLTVKSAFAIPANLSIELFAAEPQLMNPVAISVDATGRVFVAEEYRFNRGTEENRTRSFFLEDDLQLDSLEGRLASTKKFLEQFEGGIDWFTRYTDQVRVIQDRDGDGRADWGQVYAGGFNQILSGMAAGILAVDGDVFLTNIPNLWRLRDQDGDGIAEEREIILSGFGVNFGFLGHDLHGLVMGPDGKLYFSVGDRGFQVTDQLGSTHALPRRGAVFRCNLDGSDFEVVHIGLRNPQELAFDEYGNLFTADNNCDKGDYSRLVMIVPGGDSGWDMRYQSIPEPYLTGPWISESMYQTHSESQSREIRPAWVLPPIGKLGAGPSGFTYCGAAGWPAEYRGRFYMCNYTGNGGIESFRLEPYQASFHIASEMDLIKPIQATDCEFGFDGKLYVSDFVGLNWNGGSQGGRVFTLQPNSDSDDESLKEQIGSSEQFFGKDVAEMDTPQLVSWLKHSDYRVRQRAQFGLVKKGNSALVALGSVASDKSLDTRCRLHGLWGLSQLVSDPTSISRLLELCKDPDGWIRANAIKGLATVNRADDWKASDNTMAQVESALIGLLLDEEPHVAMQAALAVGRLKIREAVPTLLALADRDGTDDGYTRHSVAYALSQIEDRESVYAMIQSPSRQIRLISLLTMRRWLDPRIGEFLNDNDIWIVTEAARAIHDLAIDDPQLALASLVTLPQVDLSPEPLLRRLIASNYLLGTEDALNRVLYLSKMPGLSALIRQEALKAIEQWATPVKRDRVTGQWRPSSDRDASMVKSVLENSFSSLLDASKENMPELLAIVSRYDLPMTSLQFEEWFVDDRLTSDARINSLRWLLDNQPSNASQYLSQGINANDPSVRAFARERLFQASPESGHSLFDAVLSIGTTSESQSADAKKASSVERQSTIAVLSQSEHAVAEEILLTVAKQTLVAPNRNADIHLELIEAVGNSTHLKRSPGYQETLKQLSDTIVNQSNLKTFQASLWGGNADRGKTVFYSHVQAQCIRCHRMSGKGGDAGPNLSNIGSRALEKVETEHSKERNTGEIPEQISELAAREYLAYSLIEPDRHIAPGYATSLILTTSGETLIGVITKEDTEFLELMDSQKKLQRIAIEDIEDRRSSKSAMPSMETILKPNEVRDLVDFLVQQRNAEPPTP